MSIDHSLLRAFAEAGISDRRLAAHYGVSDRTVLRWRRSEGIASAWKPREADHGTRSKYNTGCRCGPCLQSLRDYMRDRRESGDIPDGAAHGLSVAANYGCRCSTCLDAVKNRNREMRKRAASGQVRHLRGGTTANCPCAGCRRRAAQRAHEKNEETREKATKHFQIWTSTDMELAADYRYSAHELAILLGRTRAAVQSRRRLMRDDPRLRQVIDLGEATLAGKRRHGESEEDSRPQR